MIKRLADFLAGRSVPKADGITTDEMQLAVAALLIEAARMDGAFDAKERGAIEKLLKSKFGLDAAAVASVVSEAEQKVEYSAQYFPFTNAISKAMSIEQRAEIIEMMWVVAYSDGALDPYEDMLLRQVAGLMHVPDRERGLARQRAIEIVREKSNG